MKKRSYVAPMCKRIIVEQIGFLCSSKQVKLKEEDWEADEIKDGGDLDFEL